MQKHQNVTCDGTKQEINLGLQAYKITFQNKSTAPILISFDSNIPPGSGFHLNALSYQTFDVNAGVVWIRGTAGERVQILAQGNPHQEAPARDTPPRLQKW